ncbi:MULTISPECIES: hypothetical protein [Streptomyces]
MSVLLVIRASIIESSEAPGLRQVAERVGLKSIGSVPTK